MRFLLDENFPIQLQRRLIASGHVADHIIALGLRRMPDWPSTAAAVIISRVPQHLRIADRVELWGSAIDAFVRDAPAGRLFELLANGVLVPLPE